MFFFFGPFCIDKQVDTALCPNWLNVVEKNEHCFLLPFPVPMFIKKIFFSVSSSIDICLKVKNISPNITRRFSDLKIFDPNFNQHSRTVYFPAILLQTCHCLVSHTFLSFFFSSPCIIFPFLYNTCGTLLPCIMKPKLWWEIYRCASVHSKDCKEDQTGLQRATVSTVFVSFHWWLPSIAWSLDAELEASHH